MPGSKYKLNKCQVFFLINKRERQVTLLPKSMENKIYISVITGVWSYKSLVMKEIAFFWWLFPKVSQSDGLIIDLWDGSHLRSLLWFKLTTLKNSSPMPRRDSMTSPRPHSPWEKSQKEAGHGAEIPDPHLSLDIYHTRFSLGQRVQRLRAQGSSSTKWQEPGTWGPP